MSLPIIDPRIATNSYAEDPIQRKLQIDELKKHIQGGQNKEEQLREACQGFESVFIQQIWEQMRKGVPKSGLMEGRDQEMYQSLFDVELSKKMASAGGIGLADMLYEQLSVKLGEASRATSPGMLKGNQVMKELDEPGNPIELKPYYGSLKIDPETELAQRRGESVPGSLYDELKEDGLEYVNPYVLAGQTVPVIEKPEAEIEENLQADNTLPLSDLKAWQQMASTAVHAYVGNMQQDVDSVGSIGVAKNNIQQSNTTPAGIGTLIRKQEGQAPGVKIINPADIASLMEVMVNKTQGVSQGIGFPGDIQAAAASAMEVPGFSGMKAPFPKSLLNPQVQQLSTGINSANIFDPSVSVRGFGQMPRTGIISEAEVESSIIPGKATTPLTGVNKSTNEQSELSSIPEGMFMSFDDIPDI